MKKALSAVALAIVFSAAPARATNGIRMIGFGPVQNSMGGASVGAGLDAASVLTNPATMSDLGGRVDFGATYFTPTVKYTASANAGPYSSMFVVNDTQQTSDRGASPVPAFGLVVPFNDKVTFGLGAYGVAGLGTDYKFNALGSTVYTNYSQMRFAPGVAYKVNDLVSVGVTANVMYNVLGYSLGGSAFGQVPHNDTSAMSVSGTVGVRVTPMKGLAIGVAYESQSAGQKFKYNLPDYFADPNMDGTQEHFAATREELTMDSPQVATLGAAYRPLPTLLVALDLQWINWSGVMGADQPKYDVSNGASMPFNVDWKDQYVVKVGAEFEALPTLKIRAGYNYGSEILNKEKAFQNIAFPAVAQHHITAGVGYQATPKFTVNVGAMYSPEAKLSADTAMATPMGPVPVKYETKMSQLAIDAGLAYKF